MRGGRPARLDTTHAFTEHEWTLVRVVADGLEGSYGWRDPAAQRLRFLPDFAYATGLGVSELVSAQLTVRDKLRHAWLATTSMYLHTDDARRAKHVADRIAAPRS